MLASGTSLLYFLSVQHGLIGVRIEGACYFLASSDSNECAHAAEFEDSIQELVDMIEKAQQPDGYLDIYFTVVDPEGRFKNLRDMHEMCE